MADIVIINKVDTADPEAVQTVEANVRALNPKAVIVRADSPVTVDSPSWSGKRVLVIEDGPTLTHGEMRYGAGLRGRHPAAGRRDRGPAALRAGLHQGACSRSTRT